MIPVLMLQAETVASQGLTPFAWAFMLISMGSVSLLTVWCFNRILRGKEHFDPDGTGPARPPEPARTERRDGA